MAELELIQNLISNVPDVLTRSANAAREFRDAAMQEQAALDVSAESLDNFERIVVANTAENTAFAESMKTATPIAYETISAELQDLFNWQERVTEENSVLFAAMKESTPETWSVITGELGQYTGNAQAATQATNSLNEAMNQSAKAEGSSAESSIQSAEALRTEVDGIVLAKQSISELIEMRQKGVITEAESRAAIDAGIVAREAELGGFEAEVAAGLEDIAVKERLAQATQEESAAELANAEATNQAAKAQANHGSVVKEGKLIMGAMIADMALMQATAGETNPALKQMGDALKTTIDVGLLGFIATGNPVVAVIMGIGAATLSYLQIANQTTPEMQSLNKELDGLGKKEDAVKGLQELTGWTNEDAAAAMNAAKSNQDLADAIIRVRDAHEGGFSTLIKYGEYAQAHGKTIQDLTQADYDAIAAQDKLTDTQLNSAEAAAKVTEANKQLSDVLARDTTRNAAAELADLAGISQQAAKDFLSAASSDADLAAQTQDLTQKIIQEEAALAALIATGKALPGDIAAIRSAIDGWKSDLDGLIAKQQATAAAMQAAGAGVSFADSEVGATHKVNTAYQTLQNSLADIAHQRTVRAQAEMSDEEKANRSHVDEMFKIQQGMDDSIDKSNRSLRDAEANAGRELRDKEADQAYQYGKKVEDVNDQIAKGKRDLADKIYQIERDLQSQLAAQGFNEALNLQKAKTENEKGEIELRAMFERSQSRERASNQEDDAARRESEQEKQSKRKQQRDEEDYRHAIEIDKREYAEKLEDARRSNEEQIADAQKRETQELLASKHKNEEQIADLRARLKVENEQLDYQAEQDRKRYEQSIANDTAATNKKIENIAKWLEAQTKAFQSAMMEETALIELFEKGNKMVAMPTAPWVGVTGRQEGGPVEAGMPYLVGEKRPEIFVPETSGVIVPTTGAIATGNEQNIINNLGGNAHTFNITIQTNDPDEMWRQLQQRLGDELFRPNGGSSFLGR